MLIIKPALQPVLQTDRLQKGGSHDLLSWAHVICWKRSQHAATRQLRGCNSEQQDGRDAQGRAGKGGGLFGSPTWQLPEPHALGFYGGSITGERKSRAAAE